MRVMPKHERRGGRDDGIVSNFGAVAQGGVRDSGLVEWVPGVEWVPRVSKALVLLVFGDVRAAGDAARGVERPSEGFEVVNVLF